MSATFTGSYRTPRNGTILAMRPLTLNAILNTSCHAERREYLVQCIPRDNLDSSLWCRVRSASVIAVNFKAKELDVFIFSDAALFTGDRQLGFDGCDLCDSRQQ